MKVGLIGAGNMGISWAGAVLLAGHELTVVDKDSKKVEGWDDGSLFVGEGDIWEGIDSGHAFVSDSLTALSDVEIIFIAVQTPEIISPKTGYPECDFTALTKLLKELLPLLSKGQMVILGSTVFPGTIDKVIKPLWGECEATFVYQPVFLRVGCGVMDFLHPSKIVIGLEEAYRSPYLNPNCSSMDPKWRKLVKFVESTTWNDAKPAYCSYEEAEFIKLMHNTFMCVKINFANEFGMLCDRFDVDSDAVTHITFDESSQGRLLTLSHMRAGPPFSGTCLPKDSAILQGILAETGLMGYCQMLANTNHINYDRIRKAYLYLTESDDVHTVGVIGMGFRPGYPDARHSLAVEFRKIAIGDETGTKFWDPAFDLDDITLDLVGRGDDDVEELFHNMAPSLDVLMETVDAVVVNMPLNEDDLDTVQMHTGPGMPYIDFYKNGLEE